MAKELRPDLWHYDSPPLGDDEMLILWARHATQHRAALLGLHFDSADIFDCPHPSGGHFVALKRHYTWEYPDEGDGEPEKVYHDLIWAEYPPGKLFESTYENGALKFQAVAPRVVMKMPVLVYWIKDGEVTCVNEIPWTAEMLCQEDFAVSLRRDTGRILKDIQRALKGLAT